MYPFMPPPRKDENIARFKTLNFFIAAKQVPRAAEASPTMRVVAQLPQHEVGADATAPDA